MSALYATCEGVGGSTRVLWMVLPPLIVAVWGWVLWRMAVGVDDDTRKALALIFSLCAVVGAVVFLVPEGVSGNGDYLGRFWLSLGLSAAIGGVASMLSPRVGIGRSLAAAIAGDVFLPGGLVLLFFWGLALSGSCID